MENETQNSKEEIDFEQLEQEEVPQVEETQLDENIISDVEEVKPGSSGASYTYLKVPKPGESIILTLKKLEKKAGRVCKRKSDGKQFTTGLYSNKTKTNTEFNLISNKNECLNINGWGLYYNLFGADSVLEKAAIAQGTYEGLTVKITHLLNGQHASLNDEDLKAIKGYETIEEAQKYKAMIKKAIEDGKIYKVELVE